MLTYVLVAGGGALGSLLRYQIGLAIAALVGEALPWGTIFINVSGSFLIGLFAALTTADGRWPVPPEARAFLMIGLCGGYTTFSAFSLQTLALIDAGHAGRAAINVVASVLLCLVAVRLGMIAGVLAGAHPRG